VGQAADLGLVAVVDVIEVVEVIRAAVTATAARVAAGAVATIKAAEIPKATGALAVVILAVVTQVVMTPEMVTMRFPEVDDAGGVVVMVEGDATGALTAGHPPARSNVTVTPSSFGRRRWARAVNRRARSSSLRDLAK
jgi:hypothetical protein